MLEKASRGLKGAKCELRCGFYSRLFRCYLEADRLRAVAWSFVKMLQSPREAGTVVHRARRALSPHDAGSWEAWRAAMRAAMGGPRGWWSRGEAGKDFLQPLGQLGATVACWWHVQGGPRGGLGLRWAVPGGRTCCGKGGRCLARRLCQQAWVFVGGHQHCRRLPAIRSAVVGGCCERAVAAGSLGACGRWPGRGAQPVGRPVHMRGRPGGPGSARRQVGGASHGGRVGSKFW